MTYVIMGFALLLSACGSNTPMQFYMLNADTAPSAEVAAPAFNKNLLVGLGPIHLPDYLNRPQIVVEVSENQYRLDERHRWAERLDQNIGRSLAQFLANRLGVEQIVRFPWPQQQTINYQVSIDILEFNQTADGHSRLQGQWQIRHDEKTLLSRRIDCSIEAKDEADAIVKAQSACLGRLGTDIESGLRQLSKAD